MGSGGVRNCLTYAFGMWLRFGGYVRMRKSMIAKLHGVGKWHIFNLVPHFLHESKSGEVTQLIRTAEENANAVKKGPWLDWIWLWHFKGHIVKGDKEYQESDVK